MAQVKAHEVENYLTKPNESQQIVLIYGPDRGLVFERANQFAKYLNKQHKLNLEDPFATIKLTSETLNNEPTRLNDEANTIAMFGGKRLIWVKKDSEKIIANKIKPILENPPPDTFILIEGGELRPSSVLRKSIEQAKTAIALPCYQDSTRALDSIIDREIKKHKLTIEPNARMLLKSLIGEDRMASTSEINKLCLYSLNDGEITTQHILDIVGDASTLAIDNVVDSVATGNNLAMDKHIRRLIAKGTSPVQIALALQRHFQTLHRLCVIMQSEKCASEKAMMSIRPPIHFQRKPFFTKALAIWQINSLGQILPKLQQLSLEVRQQPELAATILNNRLLFICLYANSINRNK